MASHFFGGDEVQNLKQQERSQTRLELDMYDVINGMIPDSS